MEKYYFKPKLDEGVLYQKSVILTVSAGGIEYHGLELLNAAMYKDAEGIRLN